MDICNSQNCCWQGIAVFAFVFAIRAPVEVTDAIMPQPQLNKQLETEDNGIHQVINSSTSTLSPADPSDDHDATVTFLIGFGILILFVLAGIMVSVFLCMTLKRDSYLWEVVFDGGPAPPEEQQPCQDRQSSDAAVLEEQLTPSPSVGNKKFSTDNGDCCTISVDSYTIECHRNADAIL